MPQVVLGWHSQRARERRWHAAAAFASSGAAVMLMPLPMARGAPGAAFALLTLAVAAAFAGAGAPVVGEGLNRDKGVRGTAHKASPHERGAGGAPNLTSSTLHPRFPHPKQPPTCPGRTRCWRRASGSWACP
jgi:hypothetical protein